MLVKDVMTKDVKYVEIPGTRTEAMELLRKLNASAIPAVKSGTGELIGMVTLRNLFEHPDEDQLAMLVDRNFLTVGPEDGIEEAARKMVSSFIRRLPVIKDNKVVGIITVKDIVNRALSEMNIEKPAADYMRPHVIAIWEGTPLKAAVEIMYLANFRGLPVINENGDLVGIIDDSDVMKVCDVEMGSRMSQVSGKTEGDSWSWDSEARVYITKKEIKIPNIAVKDAMTKDLITITRKTSISRTAQLMKQHRVDQTPVLSGEGKMVGLVRDIDLLRVLVK
ncbi:MAG: CBS domain-containing protein [Candidatus Hadarchaeales archaeon]